MKAVMRSQSHGPGVARRYSADSNRLRTTSTFEWPTQSKIRTRNLNTNKWNRLALISIALYALFYSWVLRRKDILLSIGGGNSTNVLVKSPVDLSTPLAVPRNITTNNTQFRSILENGFRNLKEYHLIHTSTTRPHTPENHSTGLLFIDSSELRQRDFFSDSWLINRQRFLEIDVSRIGIVEDAAFAAVGNSAKAHHSYSKMFYDWNDFSVEHLSKWWGVLQALRGGDPGGIFDHVIGMLERYMKERVQPPTTVAVHPLQDTIAMIAFAPYKARVPKHDPDGAKSQRLTAYSLAATIASLHQAGFGRVVVVGINQTDKQHVEDSIDILDSIYGGETDSTMRKQDKIECYLTRLEGTNMEVAFVQVTDPTWISNGKVERNVPRAAIFGMRQAMRKKLNATETSKWLGNHKNAWQHWNNVYLTEPDTLLHIRPELLSKMSEALQEGLSFFPHRLHPLPHESDLPAGHTLNPGAYLPNIGHFSNISSLISIGNSVSDYVSCCDGGGVWPGNDGWEKSNGCRPFWTCGFHHIELDEDGGHNQTELLQKHERLELYPMMVR